MNAYNPLNATKRLEAAGLDRRQAEAIASEIGDSKSDLVTNQTFEIRLDSALNKQLAKIGVMMVAVVGLACTIMSLVISIK